MWENVKTTLMRTPVLVGVASAASAAAGAILGYRVAQTKLEKHYAEISQQEIEDAKAFYSRIHKTSHTGEPLTIEEVAKDRLGDDAAEALRDYAGVAVEAPAATEEELITEVVAERVEVTTRRVFDEEKPDLTAYEGWNYETEVARRNGDRPYIISEEEYLNAEREGYEQVALTYFENDDVLIDESEDIIPDPDGIVGEDNLMRFGHGTRDKNALYIRNEQLETEFEIVRSKKSYTADVLGFIEHSHKSRARKFRDYDD